MHTALFPPSSVEYLTSIVSLEASLPSPSLQANARGKPLVFPVSKSVKKWRFNSVAYDANLGNEIRLRQDNADVSQSSTAGGVGNAASKNGGWRKVGRANVPEVETSGKSKLWVKTESGWVLKKFVSKPEVRARRLRLRKSFGSTIETSEEDSPATDNPNSPNFFSVENGFEFLERDKDQALNDMLSQINNPAEPISSYSSENPNSVVGATPSVPSMPPDDSNSVQNQNSLESYTEANERFLASEDSGDLIAGDLSNKAIKDSKKRSKELDNVLANNNTNASGEKSKRLSVNLDLLLYRAREYARVGSNKKAEKLLLECIADWPDDARAYVSLGKVLLKQGRIDEARRVYDNGCQAVKGENAHIWQAWGVLEEKSGNITQARRLFDAATVANEKHAPAWHAWALLEMRQNNAQKARDLLNKGLKFCGSNEYIYQTLAEMERKLGRSEEARALYLLASKANPRSCPTWVSWGLMEAENGDTKAARKLFQRALEVSPKNRYAFQAWALLESEEGYREKARILFQRGKVLNPKDPALLQAFALFEYECGYVGIARSLLQEASVVDPKHLPVWIAWGWLEWKEGNIDEAREYYKRAVEIDSKSPQAARVFQAWGILEDRQGNYGVARELFKYAIRVNSNDKVAWLSWASMEERIGNAIRAEELRQLFLQQRTEVVDVSWELSSLIAPAVRRMKTFFKLQDSLSGLFLKDRNSSSGTILDNEKSNVDDNDSEVSSANATPRKKGKNEDEFDIDEFLAKRLPTKFGISVKKNGCPGSKKIRPVWRRQIAKLENEVYSNSAVLPSSSPLPVTATGE